MIFFISLMACVVSSWVPVTVNRLSCSWSGGCSEVMLTLWRFFILLILSPPLPMSFAAMFFVVVISWVFRSSSVLCGSSSSGGLVISSSDSWSSLFSLMVFAISFAIVFADSRVRCRPSGFIWVLWMVMGSVLAIAFPWHSLRISLSISVSLFLWSALSCG